MNDNFKPTPGKAFWIIGGLLLLWGINSCYMYWLDVSSSDADFLDMYGEDMLAIRDIVPAWSVGGYAVGVWSSLFGTICLLLRKKIAIWFYYASLAGAVIGWVWYIFDERGRAVMVPFSWGFMVFIWALCLFTVWYARRMTARGILT